MIDCVKNDCSGCTACVSVCPMHCITMRANEDGFLYPSIQKENCAKCGLCEKACPVLRNTPWSSDYFHEAWTVISADRDMLLKSSSGGLFTELAKLILKEGGCIVGAAFTEDYRSVHHIFVETIEALASIRGSKYIQSEIGSVYLKTREALNAGRKVLFSGTPCQISGLRQFLGQEYKNLILVDVVCHGTPSSSLWQKYLSSIEKQMGGITKYVSFRNKEQGWKEYSVDIHFTGEKRYFKKYRENAFMKMFLRNVCLRESCYHCKAKELGSAADITIGDFWGVEHVYPELDSSLGVSLALIHTKKGKDLFSRLPLETITRQTDYDVAVSYNTPIFQSVYRPRERNHFFVDLRSKDWPSLEMKYTRERTNALIKMLQKAKRRLIAAHIERK